MPDKLAQRMAQHIPAPKPKLPGHAESYNPPEEYIPTPEELDFIKERFERCLDLYLCPRVRRNRVRPPRPPPPAEPSRDEPSLPAPPLLPSRQAEAPPHTRPRPLAFARSGSAPPRPSPPVLPSFSPLPAL
eukprot:tig00000382_g24573.t1